MVFSLSYRSEQRVDLAQGDLKAILDRSRSNNPGLGVTGVLLFDGRYYLQTLEGDARRVGDLFLRIGEDTRHHDLIPFCVGEKETRRFPDFAMKGIEKKDTRRFVPDLAEFDFSARRLSEIHAAVA